MTKPRRTPQQLRSRDKVDRIVAAAQTLLEQEGASGFNTNRVAQLAQVGIGTLYEYFSDKHEIVRAVAAKVADDEAALVLSWFEGVGSTDLPSHIRSVVDLVLTLYDRHLPLYESMWALAAQLRESVQRPGQFVIVAEIEKRLAATATPLATHDLQVAAYLVYHIVEGLCLRVVSEKPFVRPKSVWVEEISMVVLRYLGLHN
ncbi:MAG: TetR/AcrR family transcriptional regulator [Myxococcales bacterium]|nr:TetR/AcrR family transcriptional regulator [Myxococcales bacterium]